MLTIIIDIFASGLRRIRRQINMDQGKSEQQQPPLRRVQPYESHMAGHSQHQHQQPPPQKCPRCDSPNTKFCYYNNYSLSQPRYFCKACRRYWTHGGTLRNVPVGGACRKSKRPKPSSSSSSSGGETARTQSLSPAIPSENFTSMISGQQSTALPPSTPSMGNSFYGGRGFFSPLAATQSAPAGAGQGAAENLGGVGNSEYGANMTLLQGIYLTSLKAQAPHHLQAQDEFFRSQQSFNIIPPRAVDSWTQSFINRDAASSATVSPSFWSGATATAGDDQAGSSFNPNQWSDNHPGFHPSQ